jgi:3-deoxy-D-manno-octulosonic-acid transferase
MASLPLLKRIHSMDEKIPLWISTVTATGQRTAREKIPWASGIFYFPYDMAWIVDRVIRRLRPSLFVTTETELWPNCAWRLRRYGVPMVMVNGRISDRSFGRYRRFRFLFRRALESYSLLCMQSEESARRIRMLGAPTDRVLVTGNLKFDQQPPKVVDEMSWRRRIGVEDDSPVVVAGSTHPGEEDLLLAVFRRLRQRHPRLQLVLAPRAPERFEEVAGRVREHGFVLKRRSRVEADCPGPTAEVILLDTIGELASVYSVASVVFVGGSLVALGGHNPLEAASHAKPVVFGPHMENFREISSLLLNQGGAVQVEDPESLERVLEGFLSSPDEADRTGRRALEVLELNRGAADRTLQAILPLLQGRPWG